MSERADARRHQVLQAAAACFARRGFHRATMPEICREAGLSPGTVYRYFRSKEDLIEALVEIDRAERLAVIDGIAAAPDTVAALGAAVDEALAAAADPAAGAIAAEVVAEAVRNPRVATVVRRHDESVLDALAGAIRRGQARGEIAPAVDPRLAAMMVGALVDDLTARGAVGAEVDLPSYAAFIKAALARALAASGGGGR